MKIIVMRGCSTCDSMKKAGMCKKNDCIDISTKEGQKLAREAKVTQVPQPVCIRKNGKARKCNTAKIIKKFLK